MVVSIPASVSRLSSMRTALEDSPNAVAKARKCVWVSGLRKNFNRIRILVLEVMRVSSKSLVYERLGTASPR